MEGLVTAYSGTNLTINVDAVAGTGTVASWNINLAGQPGTPLGQQQRFQYAATAGQTSFSGLDSNGATLAYTAGSVEVGVNGLWIPPSDYTATDGSTIVLSSPSQAGDVVYVFALSAFNPSDTLAKSQNGADIVNPAAFRSNLGLSTEIGKIEWWPTTVLQPGRLKANGATPLRASFPILYGYLVRSGAATFTNGSINVGMPGHKLSPFDPIKLFTTTTLPINFTAGTHGLPTVGTNYFVKTVVDGDTVTLSLTPGGAAIAAGSAGTGAHTWVNAPQGDGDGSTTFGLPDLRGNFPRGWNDDASVDTNRTIGDVQLDALQGHFHSMTGTGTPFGTVNATVPGVGSSGNLGNNGTSTPGVAGPITDGVNGAPRIAAETRPRNVSLMATIRYSA